MGYNYLDKLPVIEFIMVAAEKHLALSIGGEGVTPRAIRLRDLIELLSDLERALMATAGASAKLRKIDPDEFSISLVGLEAQLAQLHLSTSNRIQAAANRISEAIDKKSSIELPQVAAESITEMHRRASLRKWSITINNGSFSSTMTPTAPVFSDALITGTTSILGTVFSVGGRRPTAKIDIEGGGTITASVDRATAKLLAGMLYRTVVLEGEAAWYAKSLELRRFKVRSVGKFDDERANAHDAFAELRRISGDTWEGVDPDRFVRDQRE